MPDEPEEPTPPVLVTTYWSPTCGHPTDPDPFPVTYPEGDPPTVSCGVCGAPLTLA